MDILTVLGEKRKNLYAVRTVPSLELDARWAALHARIQRRQNRQLYGQWPVVVANIGAVGVGVVSCLVVLLCFCFGSAAAANVLFDTSLVVYTLRNWRLLLYFSYVGTVIYT